MGDGLPYMRLWVDDLLSDPDVHEMDAAEFGLYMRALCIAWKKGGVAADPKRRARQLGVTPRRLERLWMEGKWESDGNGLLFNPRQERERREAQEKHAKRVAAGRKGGQAKGKQ